MKFFNYPKNQPTVLDEYTTREGELIGTETKDTIYDSMIFSYIGTLLFVIIDFVCLNSSWTVVDNSSNSWMILLISIGCAFALDVPMAIAGVVAKQYSQRLINKKNMLLIVSLCIGCFLIVFVFQVCFRFVTRGDTFSSLQSSLALQNSTSTEDADSSKVIFAALFSGVIPLCTSIASFVITYFSAYPLEHKISSLKKAIIHQEANIIELNQCIIEAGNTRDHIAFLLANELDSYNSFIETIKAEGNIRKQEVRHAICEVLGEPEQTAVVEQSGNSLNDDVIDETVNNEAEIILAQKTISKDV